jgi:uncharacterized protein (TIGR00725 family)
MIVRPVYIAVCGTAEASDDESAAAAEVGRMIAEAGAVLVCGGLGGVMDAAARGASEVGGSVLGLLPGSTREGASDYLTLSVPTSLGEARNALIVRSADAVIAIGGGPGTLSEIALALKLGRPVVGLRTWRIARDVPGEEDPLTRATTPQEAVRMALEMARI